MLRDWKVKDGGRREVVRGMMKVIALLWWLQVTFSKGGMGVSIS